MRLSDDSHYKWLETHLPKFCADVSVDIDYHRALIVAHGDKCYGYEDLWEKAGIPFEHGTAVYLLTYVRPYGLEVREREDAGVWISPGQWVVDNYHRFKNHLPVE